MEQISPELFTYELYESNYMDRLGIPFDTCDRIASYTVKQHAIGWCDASRLQVRPRSGLIAIMCEDENGEKFWFHQEKENYNI